MSRRLLTTGGIAIAALAVLVARGELTPFAGVGPFEFSVRPFELRTIPADEWPYHRASRVRISGERDAEGVRVVRAANGTVYDHPVGQAQLVVNALANYRLSGDSQDLRVAIANADRLLFRGEPHGRAIFFPYPFDFALHDRGTMRAPWYSGMAQGIALSGFVRLWEETADGRWLDAADRTFASFLVSSESGGPWVTAVDGGLVWFEEYPWLPLDHTVNGHIFATYGLWDYWRATGSPDAERLLRGALTTALEVADVIRVPGAVSRYCVSVHCQLSGAANPRYHRIHIGQYRMLFRLTGEPCFARVAELMELDQPAASRPSMAANSRAFVVP